MSFWVRFNSKNPSKRGLFAQKKGFYSRKSPKTGLLKRGEVIFKSGAVLERIRYTNSSGWMWTFEKIISPFQNCSRFEDRTYFGKLGHPSNLQVIRIYQYVTILTFYRFLKSTLLNLFASFFVDFWISHTEAICWFFLGFLN